jgi:hypothetical protein
VVFGSELIDCPYCGIESGRTRWSFQLGAKEYDELVAAYRARF